MAKEHEMSPIRLPCQPTTTDRKRPRSASFSRPNSPFSSMEDGAASSSFPFVLLTCILAWIAYVLWYALLRKDYSSSLNTTPATPKKTLLLDLDETLVHSTLKRPARHSFKLDVTLGKIQSEFYVIKRPYVDRFLRQVCNWYNVYIFTAGVKDYASPLLLKLDPQGNIHGRFFRDSCTQRKDLAGLDYYVKEFSRIGMDPSQTIIIDNQPISYSLNKDSAIPIDHFFEDPRDQELLNILPCLDVLRYVQDVRSILGLRLRVPPPEQR